MNLLALIGDALVRRRLRQGALACVAALLLSACGGGGTIDAPERRALSPEFMARKAVNYSPYRTARNESELAAEVITKAMIKQDLDLLVQGGFNLIRVFDSSDKVARQTLEVIRDNGLDIKMQLGIYIVANDGAYNNAEVARGIALANEFKDIVLAVSVGNERMVSWSFGKMSPSTVRDYIVRVKSAITQPVTSDDNWAFWSRAYSYEADPIPVLNVVDFVAMHTYPMLDSVFAPDLWDWRQASVPPAQRAVAMMDAAIERAKFEFASVRTHLESLGFAGMPIVIGETGWKGDAAALIGRAHPVNQKMYFDRLAAWKAAAGGPQNVFWFEGFDEPWKQGDDKWGLFNVNRQARYVVQGLYPASIWEPGTYTPADAVYVVSLEIRPAITAARYTAYADAVTPGEARPVLEWWNAWENGLTAVVNELTGVPGLGDPVHSFEIAPKPMVWGWGVALPLPANTGEDLSAFANGTLNFTVRTTYPGRIEVGFYVGSVTDGSAFDTYISIGSGEFGYANDGTWRQVSIPIDVIRQRVAAAASVPLSRIDLGRVTNPIVIADRYGVTGKASGSNVTNKIEIDAIYWAR